MRAIERFCDMSKLDVHLYEAASQISEIGAGLNIWQRVYDILTDLGLEDDMKKYLDSAETTCELDSLVECLLLLITHS